LLQILGLALIALLLIWLVLRARKRAQKRRTPPTVSTIVAAAGPVAAESNGSAPELAAASNGAVPEAPEPDEVSESDEASEPDEIPDPEAELREIYDKVGHPDSFDEAKGKVTALAGELVERDGIDMNEALRIAYGRSLDEHREYLAAKGLA
jgi:hypothetical protein